jgi:oligopeptide/dipeptide ABC transporter ATP-binding protein
MSNNLLEMKNLTTSFKTSEGKVTAVHHVDMTIEKGKTLGVVGESGCGKSVTSLSIMRLLPAKQGFIDTGKILFDGRNLLDLNESEMQEIRGNQMAMIFQEPMTALNPVFTIGDQIGESLALHKGITGEENRKKCIELLKKVRIPRPDKVIDEHPHQLSGGMRQRVMIAMALSCDPKLLIADEPTTALDVTIQAQVLELMKSLTAESGMSCLFITHDLGVIAEMADEVAVMYAGRVVEQADVVSLFDEMKHPYTKGLFASRVNNVKKGECLQCISGMVPPLSQLPKGCAFAPRCSECMPICHEKMPELTELSENHKVRCWLYSEGKENE